MGLNKSGGLNRVSLSWPHQPSNRFKLEEWYLSFTKTPEGAPGPPFKYLYPHHAAKSISQLFNSNCTFPAACAKSRPMIQLYFFAKSEIDFKS